MDSDHENNVSDKRSSGPPAKVFKKTDRKDQAPTTVRVTPAVMSLIERHSTRLTAPAPRHDTYPVPIRVADYQPWLISLYQSITNALYSGYPLPLDIITENNFTIVGMILIAEKLLLIDAHTTNARQAFRPRYLNRLYMPLSLVHVLNGLGLHMVKNSAYQIYPQPDDTVNLAYYNAAWIENFDGALATEFSKLINNAAIKQCCFAGYAGTSPFGDASWCLSAFDPANNALAAGNSNVIVVRSIFAEAKEQDVIIAALVQNGFNGNLIDANVEMTFEWKTYAGIPGMREYFNTHP